VAKLGPRQSLSLDSLIEPPAESLTKGISRYVVKRVLAGRRPVTRWPVRITYRGGLGEPYATCCEIRVVRLPLEISAVCVRCTAALGAHGPQHGVSVTV
jgi:hypothetical protein